MSIPSYLNSDLYPPYKHMHFGQPIPTSYLAGLRKVWYCLGMQGLAILSQQRNQGTWEPPIGRGETPGTEWQPDVCTKKLSKNLVASIMFHIIFSIMYMI